MTPLCGNTAHTSVVKDFIEELGLTCSWERFPIDFTCCHDILGVSHVSTLDHFFWSPQLDEYVTDAGVLHLTDNRSDHSPIFCAVRYPHVAKSHSQPNQRKPKPSWCKARCDQREKYKVLLEDRINKLEVPTSVTSCRDVHCQDPAHISELDIFTMELLETMQDVAEEVLPITGSGGFESSKQRTVPGWSESVKPFREEAYFWHQVWVSCGRPLNTELHCIMKKSRNKYHYEYKKCSKAETKIKSNKLLDSCLNGGGDL